MVTKSNGKKKGLMSLNKEELVKRINDLQNQINNPSPHGGGKKSGSTSTSSSILGVDDTPKSPTTTPSPSLAVPSTSATSNGVLPSTDVLDSILQRISSLETTVKKLENENTSLRYQVKNLRQQIEEVDDNVIEVEKDVTRLDQYTRRWNIEVRNIPDDVPQDHLKPSIAHALQQMNINVNEDGIEAVHRLKKSKKAKGPAPVIVRFRKRDHAFETLSKKQECKKITNDTFGPTMRTKIFIHENLGPRAKKIFDFCLQQQRDGRIFKVWTVKGITNFIYENDRNEKPTQVYHYDELWNLFPDD